MPTAQKTADSRGKMRLSRKALLEKKEEKPEEGTDES